MFRVFLSVAATLAVLVARLDSNPLPKNTNQPPSLSGECAYGTIAQSGKLVTISGHPTWKAWGFINKSGLLEVTWQHAPNGRLANAYYIVTAESLTGRWYWCDDICEDGLVCEGDMHDETIQRKP